MTVEDDLLLTQVLSGRTDALGVLFERYFRFVFDKQEEFFRNRGGLENDCNPTRLAQTSPWTQVVFDQQEIGTLIEDTYLQSSIPIA